MKIDRIRCFISVGKTLNFSQSAKELYLSQPSISRIITSLEEEVGVKLFDRSGKQMTLTNEGRIFLERCKQIVKQWDHAVQEVQLLQMKKQELRVGILGFSEDRLLSAIEHLEKDFPDIHLSMEPLDFAHPFELLDSGALDCFMYWSERTPAHVAYLPLLEETRKAYFNKQHPLSQQKSVTMAQLATVPQIVFNYGDEVQDQMYINRFPAELRDQIRLIKVKDVMTSRRQLELNKGVILAPNGGILTDSSQVCEVEIEKDEQTDMIRLGLVYLPDNQNVILKKLITYL